MSQPTTISRTGLLARLIVSMVALALLLYGTFFGSDDDFPFGPFRMFAIRNSPDGTVHVLRLEGTIASGETIVIDPESVGLRRAELEGRLPRMSSEPELMTEIVLRYEENNPDAPELVLLQVIKRIHQLADGLDTGQYVDRVTAVWVRP